MRAALFQNRLLCFLVCTALTGAVTSRDAGSGSHSDSGDDDGDNAQLPLSEGGSVIEHKSVAAGDEAVPGQLAFLRNEIGRVSTLQAQVLRQLNLSGGSGGGSAGNGGAGNGGGDDTFEDEPKESFEDDGPSNVHPSVRMGVLEEFDDLIENNEFVDDELLDAVLDRLWQVRSESEKRALIAGLRAAQSAALAGGGDAGAQNSRAIPQVQQQHQQQQQQQQQSNVEGWLSAECALDIDSVEAAMETMQRSAAELCSHEMPFTVFNGALLNRLSALLHDCVAKHRLNLLRDSFFDAALRQIVWRNDRQLVEARLAPLLDDIGELLYDEMLFANMVAKHSALHEQQTAQLHQQARGVESRLRCAARERERGRVCACWLRVSDLFMLFFVVG